MSHNSTQETIWLMCQCRIYIQIKIGSRNIVNQFIILTSLNNNLNTSKATTDANLTADLFRCIFQNKHYSYITGIYDNR